MTLFEELTIILFLLLLLSPIGVLGEVYNCGGSFENHEQPPPAGCKALTASVGTVTSGAGYGDGAASLDLTKLQGSAPVRRRFFLKVTPQDRFFHVFEGYYVGDVPSSIRVEMNYLTATEKIKTRSMRDYPLRVKASDTRRDFKFKLRTPKTHYESAFEWVVIVAPPVFHTYTIPNTGGEARFKEPPESFERRNKQQALNSELSVEVLSVLDGDTFKGRLPGGDVVTVRLYGIDSPEGNQAFGDSASLSLRNLIANRDVNLEPMNKDIHGRLVAKVYLKSGTYVNYEMVKSGMAWWFERYATGDSDLSAAQVRAQNMKVGLWAQADPTPPWNFRENNASDLAMNAQ